MYRTSMQSSIDLGRLGKLCRYGTFLFLKLALLGKLFGNINQTNCIFALCLINLNSFLLVLLPNLME